MIATTHTSISQLHHYFEHSAEHYPDNIALICDNILVSYQELEHRANQLAHYLNQNGIKSGQIIGLLLERSVESYIAILAILKTGAAYVPIDVDYPEERINYIFKDISLSGVITSTKQLSIKTLEWPPIFAMDALHEEISKQPTARLKCENLNSANLSYVIYTSGSTGKPKGVAVPHASICHYVAQASKVYEMSANDRVYHGFSLSFDASLEEIWMAFANGAALIACTSKEIRSGLGLVSFLQLHEVSFFSTVPTLLNALENDLPNLRILILGGEVCPPKLIQEWSKPGLRILNTYGPTEASVVSTYSECDLKNKINIGKPLPGYEILVLDANQKAVIKGEKGELCIGGAALANGYINHQELTETKFIPHPMNSTKKIYRTGDVVWEDNQGNFHFAGRIDDQVKLRGFRIELNEIESVINRFDGVNQAVVTVKDLEQPTLIAYLQLKEPQTFQIEALKSFLKDSLPDYMIPALYQFVDEFKLLVSGKVDRKSLPEPVYLHNKKYDPPTTEMGKKIALVWENILNYDGISQNDDFFYDLGGHSLLAAKAISSLRKIYLLKNISILDLYNNPTIKKLEAHFELHQQDDQQSEREISDKYKAPLWKYRLCGIGQFFGTAFQYALGTFQLIAIVLGYDWLSSDSFILTENIQYGLVLLFLSLPLLSLLITIALKWILLGRVKPGIYPLWGWFYFRWWLVQRLQKNLYLGKFLVGTPLAVLYFRMLGAKIGKNCHLDSLQIAAPDLLQIGDNTSINTDSRLYGYLVEDGWLKIGTINIGNDCYIGARAIIGYNTVLENNAILDDMSMLPEGGRIGERTYYTGSPALERELPSDHITTKKRFKESHTLLQTLFYGSLHYFGALLVTILYYLCLMPSLSLITHFYDQGNYLITMFFAIPIGALVFLILHYLCIVCCKKIILPKINPGSYSTFSLFYFRHWLLVKMIDGDEISIMADTLYMPAFLRLLGARLGKGVEMGETPHIIPDLVDIQEGGFTASSVALAWPQVYANTIHFAEVKIGRRGFVGNVSMLPAGKTIGENGLLGCLSTTPAGKAAEKANTAWLGSPAVYLPKRELFVGFSDKETFFPSKKLYFTRLCIEFFRIILPSTFSLIALFNMLYVLDYILDRYNWKVAAIALPFSEIFFTVTLVAVIVGLKWLMLGKLKPLTKPIWNSFIWKNDVIEYSYNYYINPHLTNKILGTPFALWIHRCLGTKAGKRVFTESAEFSEFDLISIGDEVCINAETILQTHLYEDRIFKVSHVTIQSGCNIGVGSIVLYNTLMEENSTLGSLSLLMKGEVLPENTQWAGIPAQSKNPVASFQSFENKPLQNPDQQLLIETL